MNAQILKNERVCISNGSLNKKDALYTIDNLRIGEFYRLVRCTDVWSKFVCDDRDMMFAYAPKDSKLYKEFINIMDRRKAHSLPALEINGTTYDVYKGMYEDCYPQLLLYKDSITLVDSNQLNKKGIIVSIDERQRNEFVMDVTSIHGSNNTKVYRIKKGRNPVIFDKWCKFIINRSNRVKGVGKKK